MSQAEMNSVETQLLSDMLGSWQATPVAPVAERREKPRKTYPYLQTLAPMQGEALPTTGELKKVRCHDISGGGFSFISHGKPGFESVVVGFGTPPNMLYLKAKVIHVTPRKEVECESYVVGCRHLGRVSLREETASSEPDDVLAQECDRTI